MREADRVEPAKLGYPSDDERDYIRLGNSCWFTNIDHGRRHEPLELQQTAEAEAAGVSNCPLCAAGTNANKACRCRQNEIDADHVTAWSSGGATDLANCEMPCVTHNRSKGNR